VITIMEIKPADIIRTPDKMTARNASPLPAFLRFLGEARRFFAAAGAFLANEPALRGVFSVFFMPYF
jgi:hypothetical protein